MLFYILIYRFIVVLYFDILYIVLLLFYILIYYVLLLFYILTYYVLLLFYILIYYISFYCCLRHTRDRFKASSHIFRFILVAFWFYLWSHFCVHICTQSICLTRRWLRLGTERLEKWRRPSTNITDK
jgi:hypothetical protein